MTHEKVSSASADIEIKRSDARIRRIQSLIMTTGKNPSALIQILHAAQELFGYLPKPVLTFIAEELRIPASRVYGVVTFYHFFTLKPQGQHTCVVCMGTACYVKGAQLLVDQIEKSFGIKPGEVTADNQVGFQLARCIGSCGMAPAVVFDGEVWARVQTSDIVPKIQGKLGEAK
jgi:bidirectional [NiFe] hydrogenase diaphorase subunit